MVGNRIIHIELAALPEGCGTPLPPAVGWFVSLTDVHKLQERFNGNVSEKMCGRNDNSGSYIICDRCVKKAGLIW